MAFEAFVTRDSHRRHRRRLGTSSLLAAALLAVGLAIGARAAAGHAAAPPPAEAPDDVLDVKLTEAPPPPEPPAPASPPAPAALVPRSVKVNPDAPPPRPVADPKEVPRERPREADPSQDRGVAGVHEGGDAAGVGTGRPGATGAGAATAAPAPPPPASTAPPAPRVTSISEDTEPPVPLSQARPQPPADFIAAGEDAVVVVKFEVTEAGTVAGARIVKGHPLLDAVVLAAVRAWTFRPAMSQGRPVAYPKTVKLPFKIRT